ncbi:hypothetical protein BK120_16655 [Paenibacillus sp. FSL A5-0031]|uniref:hypothetical protein n=1 Tax=Paenibacillus sp. FSL A5-0031 TaxID=1920420 RepID=UPI00096CAADF|nr:hypothetical protein [Paenibacillus sp. FSL A5-0031]OME82281.1 hypothetical protein BK120_16655 [Paenibacillus sp. FSL A5-0031]
MNHKLIISRVVLSSALLMSAVAGPAISNAASKAPAPEKFSMLQNVTASTSISADATTGVAVVNSFTNPLDLAKKYAPDTLADWQDTLDQYEKTIGSTMKNLISSVEAIPAISAGKETISISKSENVGTLSMSTAAVKISDSTKLNIATADVVQLDKNTGTAVQMTEATISEADSADMAFIRAEIKLAQAVQAEDAAAIKQSLSELLVQYKQQIADWKAEK